MGVVTLVAIVAIVYVIVQSSSNGDKTGTVDLAQQSDTAQQIADVGIVSMTLTPYQIAAVAYNAGFSDSDLVIAVAVALAESGGKSTAYNPETAAGTPSGLGSYGIWQIYLKAHHEYNATDLLDPQNNAYAAFQVYSDAGNSFRPWSTFNNGMYNSHLYDAQAAVSSL